MKVFLSCCSTFELFLRKYHIFRKLLISKWKLSSLMKLGLLGKDLDRSIYGRGHRKFPLWTEIEELHERNLTCGGETRILTFLTEMVAKLTVNDYFCSTKQVRSSDDSFGATHFYIIHYLRSNVEHSVFGII